MTLIRVEVNNCGECPFLQDEDCTILKEEIQEDLYSNINYQYRMNWRYEKCPLLHPKEYLTKEFKMELVEE